MQETEQREARPTRVAMPDTNCHDQPAKLKIYSTLCHRISKAWRIRSSVSKWSSCAHYHSTTKSLNRLRSSSTQKSALPEHSAPPFRADTSATTSQVAAGSASPSHGARMGCLSQHLPFGTPKRPDLLNAFNACAKNRPQYSQSDDYERSTDAWDGLAVHWGVEHHGTHSTEKYTAWQSKQSENFHANRKDQWYTDQNLRMRPMRSQKATQM